MHRFEPKWMIDGMLENCSFVDDVVSHDDTQNTGLHIKHEGNIRGHLIEMAKELGADWILRMEPDERYENGFGKIIRKLVDTGNKIIYQANFRELYSPTEYRCDDDWNNKKRMCLFSLFPDNIYTNKPVHESKYPKNSDYTIIPLDIDIYHFKMIEPENRVNRRDLYKQLDPNNEYQNKGYDYLADEKNIRLNKVRKYSPGYKRRFVWPKM